MATQNVAETTRAALSNAPVPGGRTSPTVTIGCKMPNGILMTVYGQEDYDVPVLGGGTRTEKRAFALGEPIRINGPAAPHGMSPKCIVMHGYALTTNVPRDIAEKWFQDNRHSELVKNNVLKIVETGDEKSSLKDFSGALSGMERLDVSTRFENGRNVQVDYRWPKSINPNMTNVTTGNKRDD